MGLTHFCIERPVFASVISILIILIGAFAYTSLPVAQYPEIAPPTIVVRASLSRRECRDGVGYRGDAAGAGDQRRREHDLHVEPGDGRRQPSDQRHLCARHRSRYRAGPGPEPCRGRGTSPAGGGPASGRDREQELTGYADGDPHHLPGRLSRPTLPVELCQTAGPRRSCQARWGRRGPRCSPPATIRCVSGSTRTSSPPGT